MKITKNSTIYTKNKNKFLRESEETVIQDVDSASVSEIKQALDNAAPEDNQEILEINQLLAKDIKIIADGLDNTTLIIGSGKGDEDKGELEKNLDAALKANLAERYDAHIYGTDPEFFNVLVTGLPGSGKTAIIHEWARKRTVNGHPIHLVEIDAKNDDLGAFINGYTMQDRTQPDKNIVTQGTSNNLDGLDEFAAVLFLDELNRQVKANIRGSLLSLINEHAISGDADQKGAKRIFNNLLFTIAAINPAVRSDKGAAQLSDAELARFDFKVHLNSSVDEARKYFRKFFKIAKNAIEGLKNSDKERYFAQLNKIRRQESLINALLGEEGDSSVLFRFDDESDLDNLAGNISHPKTMLNQRMLTRALKISQGYVDVFLNHVNNSSDWLQKDIDIINEILEDYEDPEDLTPDDTISDEDVADVSDESDAELFGSNAGKEVISAADLEDQLNDKADDFFGGF